MIIHDDRDTWIGIGYLMSGLRFKTHVTKCSTSKTGHRVRHKITWSTPSPPVNVIPSIQKALDLGGIMYEDEWTTSSNYLRLCVLIKTLEKEYKIRDAFADGIGLHMFLWCIDNPPPYDYEEFITWAEAYDSELEGIENEFSI